MARRDIERFLGISWYDGLLVNELHLSHSDQRALSVAADISRLSMDQPGIIEIDTSSSAGVAALTIAETNHAEGSVEITFNVPRTLRALAPSGKVVIVVENNQRHLGWPEASVKVVKDKGNFTAGEYVVAARQQLRPDLKVDYEVGRVLEQQGIKAGDGSIELSYPGVAVDLVDIDGYKNDIRNLYADSVVIGLLKYDGNDATLVDGHMPPVARLELVQAFAGGALADLTSLFDDMLAEVSKKQTEQNRILRENLSSDLLLKALGILTLQSFLLSKLGIIRNLGRVSPSTLFFEVVYPLSVWHEDYYRRQYGEGDVLSKFYARRPDIKGLAWEDFCVDIGPLMARGKEQIKQIIEDLQII
ncbi:MAG: hypothetical protein V3V49_00595 [Candidatus Krumholzibacteria bacterium]